jgi:hypothetical protein
MNSPGFPILKKEVCIAAGSKAESTGVFNRMAK